MDDNHGQAQDDVTRLFVSWRAAPGGADFDSLFTLLYRELRALAHRQAGKRPGDTLRTTALGHEAYLRLVDGDRVGVHDRARFRAVGRPASLAGGGPGSAGVVAVAAAPARLGGVGGRGGGGGQRRVFGGRSLEESAQVLGVSTATVERDWRKARMFLLHALDMGS